MTDWIEKEFKNLSLGDKRLDKRLLSMMNTFHNNPEGQPLGLQAVKTWSRAHESEWVRESERWVESLEEAEKLYSDETEMVYIADREADQFQVLYDTHNRGHSFVIRSKHD